MSVKDDLLDDFPHVYPGRSEIQRLLTLLDESASTEAGLSLSIATALKPLVPDVADRIASYNKAGATDDYVRMLRGAAVLLLQKWQPEEQPPAPDSMSNLVDAVEAEG